MLALDISSQISSVPTLEEAKHFLNQLDLNYIVKRISYDPKITGWTYKEAMICSKMYKNFLFLRKKYPHEIMPPSKAIDEFWHEHILYTRQYHQDCINIFGKYLHHSPGEKGKEEYNHFLKLFNEVTQKLYYSEYGEYL